MEIDDAKIPNQIDPINSSDVINIVSKNFIYRPNKFDIKIISQPNTIQYMVVLDLKVPCNQATIEFINYDNHDGETQLGEFCGDTVQTCKSYSKIFS